MMLGDNDAIATIAVRDLKAAKKFYEGTLGLKAAPDEGMGTAVYKTGKSTLLVYPSQYAGTNEATAVTWNVNDAEAVVKELKAKGVRFEHYDNMPGITRKGDVHFAGNLKNAWFKDPDGNIHSIVSRA